MFGREKETEVFMTNDLELYATVHQALKAAQIPCKVEIVNTDTQNRRTDTLMGKADERPKLEIQYYIYTPREYVKRTKYIIDEHRKSSSR